MIESAEITSYGIIAVVLLSVTALYCILVSRNLIRILIGVELLTKAATLLLVLAGQLSNRVALAQAYIITLIVIEVVVIAIAAGVVINAFRKTGTLDLRTLQELKG